MITRSSPQDSPMTIFLTVNLTAKFQREHRERGRRMREGSEVMALWHYTNLCCVLYYYYYYYYYNNY